MIIYKLILLAGFTTCFVSFIIIFYKVLKSKRSKEYSACEGNLPSAILYSFTGAMSPFKKESAYLHLPTYIAGMLFHLGTFLSLIWVIIIFFNISFQNWFINVSVIFISISIICGIVILMKRIILKNLKVISNPDDYFSNMLVVLFQFCTICTLLQNSIIPVLFVFSAILFVYIPIGKLKHSIYFFTSRIYLGMFYGRRKVWGSNKIHKL